MQDTESGFFVQTDTDVSTALLTSADKYVVGERLNVSVSGFTELYLAKRAGRLFVIKSLKEEHRLDPVAVAALNKEFNLGFRLDSPGIVRTFDLTDIEGYGVSIILEYCAGADLRRLMDSGQIIEGKRLEEIANSLVASVRTMHGAGVIHRDIKPANIMYDSLTGNARLIDFGCADSFDLSLFKGPAGTAIYKSKDFSNTPADDWYALSLTLRELAEHCDDKESTGRVLTLCKALKNGKAPERNLPVVSGRKWKWIVSVSALLLIIIFLMFHFFINEKEIEMTKPVTESADVVSEKQDNLFLGQENRNEFEDSGSELKDSKMAENVVNERGENEKAHEIKRNPLSVNIPGNDNGIRIEESEFRGASKNNIDPDKEISEVNFCSVNGKYDPIVALVRDATDKVWLAAERRKAKIYNVPGLRLTPRQRDSIDRLVYDEKTCCEAILKEMGKLPPDVDMNRVRRLVRQRYMTMFPDLSKKRYK